jgi:cell division protein FtsW
MLYLGGVKPRYLAVLGLGAAGLFAVFLFQASYRLERIAGFMEPDKDPLGNSFQVIQSKLAVGSGGLLGLSLGQSTQKLYFLPCAHTDFIYAILGEEFGLLGTLAILLLFLVLLWRGLAISARAPTLAGQLTAAGLTLGIFVQALLNISIVLGLGPAKGVPLPLVSFGRSSLISNLAAIGIILNISQRKRSERGKR